MHPFPPAELSYVTCSEQGCEMGASLQICLRGDGWETPQASRQPESGPASRFEGLPLVCREGGERASLWFCSCCGFLQGHLWNLSLNKEQQPVRLRVPCSCRSEWTTRERKEAWSRKEEVSPSSGEGTTTAARSRCRPGYR